MQHVIDSTGLIELARNGDEQALGELLESLRSYFHLVTQRALPQRLASRVSASDVVQHGYLKVHQNIRSFRGHSEDEFRSWVQAIVKNCLVDTYRSHTVTERRSINHERHAGCLEMTRLADNLETPSRIVALDERDRILLLAVESLPARRRQVVQLRHAGQLSYSEIASRLGISESVARQDWTRAMRELREVLESRV